MLLVVSQVLCMSKEEFTEFTENEGWEEDEEDEEMISLAFSYEGLPGVNDSWKWLIHAAARLTVKSYSDKGKGVMEAEAVDSDWALIEDKAALAALNHRQRNALQVRCGQKSILYKVMELTKS